MRTSDSRTALRSFNKAMRDVKDGRSSNVGQIKDVQVDSEGIAEGALEVPGEANKRWPIVLLVALCAALAIGVVLTSWQAYQWRSATLQATSLSQGFMEVNDALLELLEERSGE